MNTRPTTQRRSPGFRRSGRTIAQGGCLALGFLLLASNPASSATLTWDNATSTGNWATDANWTGAIWNSATPDDAVFDATGVGSVNVNGIIKAKSVTVKSPGYTIANGGGTLQVNGAFTNNADLTLSALLAGSLTNASGNLIIAALETNTGFTVINGGMVSIATGSGLYNGPSAVTTASLVRINSGGTLSIWGSLGNGAGVALGRLQPSTNTLIINGGTWQHTGASNPKTTSGSGRLFTMNALGATLESATPGSEFSVGYRYDFQPPGVIGSTVGGTLTLSGDGDGDLNFLLQGTGGLIKKGPGTWKLSNVNTYSGATVIMEGTLALANGVAVTGGQGSGSLASPSITVSNGATFDVSLASGGFTLKGSQTLFNGGIVNGSITAAPGSTIYAGTDGDYATGTFYNDVTLNSGVPVYFGVGSLASGANDSMAVYGTLTLSATTFHIKAPSTSASLDTTQDYVLMSASSISGSPNPDPVFDVAPLNAAYFKIAKVGNTIVLRFSTGTPPSGVASANPSTVTRNQATLVTVTVTPGSNPIAGVTVNSIGGAPAVDLVNAGGNVWTNTVIIGPSTGVGSQLASVLIEDTATLSGLANLALTVVATNQVWNGGGADGSWATNPNWDSGAAPGYVGDSVTMAGNNSLWSSMDASYSLTGLTFDSTAGSFVIGTTTSGTLTLAGSGLTNVSTNAQTLNFPVVMTTNQLFDTLGDVTVSTLGQPLSSTAGLTKAGNGTLLLDGGISAYTGATTINGGTLRVQPGSKMYNTGGGPLTINAGATLSFGGGWGWNQTFGLHGVQSQDNIVNGGTIQHTGNSNQQNGDYAGRLFTIGALGATLDSAEAGQVFSVGFRYDYPPVLASSAGGRLTLTGVGDGVLDFSLPGSGGLTKTGSGTWTMSGSNNTYTGSTIIQEGTLNFNRPVISVFTTLVIQTNTVLNLNFTETNAIGGLVLDGVSMPPGVYDATTSSPYIQGSGSLLVRTGPSALFTMAPTSGVSTLTVSFTNTSSGTPFGSVLWTFGNGGSSTATNLAPLAVTYKYTNYTCAVTTNYVALKVDNGAGISIWTNPTPVLVYPAAPVASFGVDSTNVAAATTVTFTNLASECVALALWNFGDGNFSTSTGLTVTHAYAGAGTHQVTLAVTNAYGYGTVSSIKTVVVTNQSSVVGIPHITSIQYQGSTNVVLVGTNVASGIHTYYVLGATNAAQARSSWQSLVTNQCNADGSFSISVPVRGADQFYLLQVPQP